MNISQLKLALEESVKENLRTAINEEIDVNAFYNANNGRINVEIKQEKPRVENQSSVLCYNIMYEEETGNIAMLAFNRVYVYDNIGISLVNNEPLSINNSFMEDIKNIIGFAIDKVYHPEKYVADEDADKVASEE